jgi:hypothetical protein
MDFHGLDFLKESIGRRQDDWILISDCLLLSAGGARAE